MRRVGGGFEASKLENAEGFLSLEEIGRDLGFDVLESTIGLENLRRVGKLHAPKMPEDKIARFSEEVK